MEDSGVKVVDRYRPSRIRHLRDVSRERPSHGDALVYDEERGLWVPRDITFELEPASVQTEHISDQAVTPEKLSELYALEDHDHDGRYYPRGEADDTFATVTHIHDDRYFTKVESDNRYSQHNHSHDDRYYTKNESDSRYSSSSHDHDDRYYTKNESDARYADTNHQHDGVYVSRSGDTMTGDLVGQRFHAEGTGTSVSSTTTTHQYQSGASNTWHTKIAGRRMQAYNGSVPVDLVVQQFGGRLMVGGNEVWHEGNLDPSTMDPGNFGFRAFKSGQQSFSQAVNTKISWSGVNHLNGTGWSTVNNRYTVPSSGIYFLSVAVLMNSVSGVSQNRWVLMVYVNGSEELRIMDGSFYANDYFQVRGTTMLPLNQGNYVEIFLNSVGGSATNYSTTDRNFHWWVMRKVY